jgi:hypothetical protein
MTEEVDIKKLSSNRLVGCSIFLLSILVPCIFFGEIFFLNTLTDSIVPRSYFYATGFLLIFILHFSDESMWVQGRVFLKAKMAMSMLFLLMVASSFVYIVRFNVDFKHEYSPLFLAAILVPLFFGCMGVIFSRFGVAAYLTSFASLIICLAIAIIMMLVGFSLGLGQSSIIYRGDAEYLFDMHYFADYFSVIALIFLSKKYRFSWCFVGLTLIFAFVLGSRTAFVFLGASVVFFAIVNRELKFARLLMAVIFFSVLCYILYVYYPVGYENLIERIFSVDKYASSFDDRGSIMSASITAYDLSCIPVGCFAFELTHLKKSGAYVHNWMSFFVSFGLLAFIIYLFYLLDLIKLILSRIILIKKYIHLVFFLILCTGFSRSYVWSYWLFIIMFVAYDASGLINIRSRMSSGRSINSEYK